MKNKKGFTLIELLAVIVVLAIIALIATPIVMNTIKNSKRGAAERGADNYIKQVETAIATSKLDGKDVADGTYTIDENGNLTGTGLPDGKLTIEMNGEKPKSGSIVIKNGQVTTDSSMTIGDYTVSYNPTNKKYEATEKSNTVTKLCTKKDGVDLNNLTYGNEFTCELGDNDAKTFYVLETNGDNVSLIMNANIGTDGKAVTSASTDKGTVSWCKTGDDNSCNGDNAIEVLAQRTSNWNKITDKSMITLPSANQIATVIGQVLGENCIDKLPSWLYGNLSNDWVAPAAYWTSTPSPYDSPSYAWSVNYMGWLDNGVAGLYAISNSTIYGIRPVITVAKSQLN